MDNLTSASTASSSAAASAAATSLASKAVAASMAENVLTLASAEAVGRSRGDSVGTHSTDDDEHYVDVAPTDTKGTPPPPPFCNNFGQLLEQN